LTLFTSDMSLNYLPVGANITYANGANVRTSFVTNMGEWKIDGNAELFEVVKKANDENLKAQKKQLPKYSYPDYVLTAANAQRLCHYGAELKIKAESVHFLRSLELQRRQKKGIFGAGFLLSEKAAAEKAAAEKWTLSDDEWAIIRGLK
jgi:hypothetical protein